jgi:hypothetical protein
VVRNHKPKSARLARNDAINVGLLGRWLFAENGGATLGAINSAPERATIIGGQSWDTGKFGPVVSFPSGNSSRYINTARNLVSGLTAFTFSAWVKAVSGQDVGLFSLWDGVSNQVLIRSTGGAAYQFFTFTSGQVGTSISTAPAAGVWQHCVFRYDGATMDAWFDGIRDATTFSQSGAIATNSAAFQIAAGHGSVSERFLSGAIDNAGIWSRALSDQEILRLYEEPFAGIAERRGARVGIAGAGGTVALSGVSATASVGTLSPVFSIALSGVAGTTALGTLQISQALSGVSATAAVGSLSAAISVALTGLSGTTATGTLSADSGTIVALSGVSGTAAAGTLSPAFDIPLTGVSGTGAIGSLSPAGGSVDIALSGVSVTALVGMLTPPAAVVTGGHFGFDERKRKKRFDEEREDEERRKKVLREALFGLPPEEREEVTAQPEVAIERAAQTEVDYSRMLTQIQAIQDRIDEIERQDEEDLREVTELIRAGLI